MPHSTYKPEINTLATMPVRSGWRHKLTAALDRSDRARITANVLSVVRIASFRPGVAANNFFFIVGVNPLDCRPMLVLQFY